jgi:hypothetical protein
MCSTLGIKNQFTEYYVRGEFDDCQTKMSAFYECLANKIHKDPSAHEVCVSTSVCGCVRPLLAPPAARGAMPRRRR